MVLLQRLLPAPPAPPPNFFSAAGSPRPLRVRKALCPQKRRCSSGLCLRPVHLLRVQRNGHHRWGASSRPSSGAATGSAGARGQGLGHRHMGRLCPPEACNGTGGGTPETGWRDPWWTSPRGRATWAIRPHAEVSTLLLCREFQGPGGQITSVRFGVQELVLNLAVPVFACVWTRVTPLSHGAPASCQMGGAAARTPCVRSVSPNHRRTARLAQPRETASSGLPSRTHSINDH